MVLRTVQLRMPPVMWLCRGVDGVPGNAKAGVLPRAGMVTAALCFGTCDAIDVQALSLALISHALDTPSSTPFELRRGLVGASDPTSPGGNPLGIALMVIR